tara:strand:+ start:235 stop:684 length:450 start_codon:yes stop_codon:yes gene_type:complete
VATVIKLKRGNTTPTTSDIVNGEVAIDTSSKKLYINDSGTIKEVGGSNITNLDSLTDVTLTDLNTGQVLYYNGTAWINEYDYNTKGKVPFIKTDATRTSISMVNNKNMTTINGFLDHVVAPSFYLAFTNTAGSAVTTLRPGHMPELSEI